MKLLVWLAVNGLRWLTVVTFVAWAYPGMPYRPVAALIVYPPVMLRSVQLAPCPPWAVELGQVAPSRVCGAYPNAAARYKYLLKNA